MDKIYNALDGRCTKHSACGCEFSECCFECPLLVCKWDAQSIRERGAERKIQILKLKKEGKSAVEIADTIGVGKRRVFAVVRQLRMNGDL